MTTVRPAVAAAAAVQRVSDAAAAVKRDVVSREVDHLALNDLGAEPVSSMSSSARQNNKARHAPHLHSTTVPHSRQYGEIFLSINSILYKPGRGLYDNWWHTLNVNRQGRLRVDEITRSTLLIHSQEPPLPIAVGRL